jgi:hypothetical protein
MACSFPKRIEIKKLRGYDVERKKEERKKK